MQRQPFVVALHDRQRREARRIVGAAGDHHLRAGFQCADERLDPGLGHDVRAGVDGRVRQRRNEIERLDLPGPGGVLDLTECTFTELGDGTVEVRGSKHVHTPYKIKLEGSAPVGYRTITIAGTRDPIMISTIESIIDAVKARVALILGSEATAQVFFHIYGKNGVMGGLEPLKDTTAHELGIVIEVLAETQEQANTVCSLTRSTLLHYGYPGRVATAGNLAFPFSPSDVQAGTVYEFSLYHLMPIDPATAFPFRMEQVG